MKNYLEILKTTSLFSKIENNDIENLLGCLQTEIKKYSNKEFILTPDHCAYKVGILIAGEALIFNEDFWGNRNITSKLQKGDVFAEAFAVAKISPLVFVQAQSDCTVLFFDLFKAANNCEQNCSFHRQFNENILRIFATKNVQLSRKISVMSKRTTREKILSFLSDYSKQSKTAIFEIPFNRQQMADYLCVERSALSAELSKLKKEGYIDYNKSSFKLKRS